MMQKPAVLVTIAALAAACGGAGGGGSFTDAGVSGSGGSSASGGAAGAGGAAGTGGAGGSAGAGAYDGGGTAGAAGSSGGTSGAPPLCTTSADCGQADVSYPGNTGSPSPSATECVGGQCGLVTGYSGSYDKPNSPRSCAEICAASTYEGQPMACTASCTKKTSNGFGDQALVFNAEADGGSSSSGTLAGLVRYQFSPMSGAYKFVEVSCAQIPTSKLIQSGNSYTYVGHSCCCVAP